MKRNKVITVSPTRVVTTLIVFLILVTAGFVIVPRIPALFAQESTDMTAEAAARAGMEAFLSVDTNAGKDSWLDKVCQVSTSAGCKMAGKVYAPMFWPAIEKKDLRFSCKATSASQLQKVGADSATEIWQLKTVCANLNTGETNPSSAQVIVTQTADAGWKFERIQFDQETK